MGRWIVATVMLSMLIAPTPSYSAEFAPMIGGFRPPAGNYRFRTYGMVLGFGNNEKFTISGGVTHPHSFYGYKQTIYYGSLNMEWIYNKIFLKPFASFGLGGYFDKVDASGSFVFSLVYRGGVRIGGNGFGVRLEATVFNGIYNIFHYVNFIVWDAINFRGGIYFAI